MMSCMYVCNNTPIYLPTPPEYFSPGYIVRRLHITDMKSRVEQSRVEYSTYLLHVCTIFFHREQKNPPIATTKHAWAFALLCSASASALLCLLEYLPSRVYRVPRYQRSRVHPSIHPSIQTTGCILPFYARLFYHSQVKASSWTPPMLQQLVFPVPRGLYTCDQPYNSFSA